MASSYSSLLTAARATLEFVPPLTATDFALAIPSASRVRDAQCTWAPTRRRSRLLTSTHATCAALSVGDACVPCWLRRLKDFGEHAELVAAANIKVEPAHAVMLLIVKAEDAVEGPRTVVQAGEPRPKAKGRSACIRIQRTQDQTCMRNSTVTVHTACMLYVSMQGAPCKELIGHVHTVRTVS